MSTFEITVVCIHCFLCFVVTIAGCGGFRSSSPITRKEKFTRAADCVRAVNTKGGE